MTMTAQLLSTQPKKHNLEIMPRHVAVIMDGNGRWAKSRGLPRIEGHRRGANTLKEMVRYCKDLGIEILTAYAFSTENWGRPDAEVSFLMTLFEKVLRKELEEMQKREVRINFIGDLTTLPQSLQREIENSTTVTKNNRGVSLNIAMNYGSRHEMVKACRVISERVRQGELAPETINENTISKYLYTAASPDPDLLIRPGGEMRLSNFLLWQLAYTEIYVTDIFWPDFDRAQFDLALQAYRERDRRYGKVSW